jgi:acyl phosphate:glycerol-3-phosphate acyltransferase
MTQLLLKVVAAYLLGSVVGSLLLRPLAGGIDIRARGSGNAGATNALRTLGRKVALVVLFIDIAKGFVASAVIAPWTPPGFAPSSADLRAWTVTACALSVMVGHIYPLWYGFRGGKGVATLIGAVVGISAWFLIPMVLTFLIVVILFGYVGLASMVATGALLITMLLERQGAALVTFALLALVIVVFTHRGNIERMRSGTENRARGLWLFGLRRSAP